MYTQPESDIAVKALITCFFKSETAKVKTWITGQLVGWIKAQQKVEEHI